MAKLRNIALFVVLISIDQLSKYIVRTSGGFYICNQNLAFGIKFPDFLFYILWLLIIMLLISSFGNTKHEALNTKQYENINDKNSKRFFWSFKFFNFDLFLISDFRFRILVISGAISNMIDRLFFGCVTDFIDLRIWPVFNFADIYITIGAMALLMEILNIKNKNDNEKFKNERIIK